MCKTLFNARANYFQSNTFVACHRAVCANDFLASITGTTTHHFFYPGSDLDHKLRNIVGVRCISAQDDVATMPSLGNGNTFSRDE